MVIVYKLFSSLIGYDTCEIQRKKLNERNLKKKYHGIKSRIISHTELLFTVPLIIMNGIVRQARLWILRSVPSYQRKKSRQYVYSLSKSFCLKNGVPFSRLDINLGTKMFKSLITCFLTAYTACSCCWEDNDNQICPAFLIEDWIYYLKEH